MRRQSIAGPATSAADKKAARKAAEAAVAAAQPMETSIGYLVRKTHQAFIRSLELRLDPHGLSSSMYFFLRLMWQKDGLTQREISEELGLTPPTTVAAMDNLEGKGLIQRVRNTQDRRKVNIFLTKRGKELETKLRPRATEVNDAALEHLSTPEAEAMVELLHRMMTALDKDFSANRPQS